MPAPAGAVDRRGVENALMPQSAEIAANAELRERELIMYVSISLALTGGLRRRLVDVLEARLAIETGVAITVSPSNNGSTPPTTGTCATSSGPHWPDCRP